MLPTLRLGCAGLGLMMNTSPLLNANFYANIKIMFRQFFFIFHFSGIPRITFKQVLTQIHEMIHQFRHSFDSFCQNKNDAKNDKAKNTFYWRKRL